MDKPLHKHITIDLLLAVAHKTVLHPVIPWFLPLAFRAQAFHYHQPQFYLSALYALAVTALWLLQRLNTALAFGPPRAFDWTEELVLITGGASGLGLLIAEVYGMRGVTVAVLDRHVPPEGEREAGPNVHFFQCDVGSAAAVEAASARVTAELGGPVTVLINNAAVVRGTSLLDATVDDVEDSFRTNIFAHYHTLRAFLPGMVAAGRGTVVTVSSVQATLSAARGCALYAPTKAATSALHHALTAELAPLHPGIKTLLVTPGQMGTPLFAGVQTPSPFWAPVLEPVDVAKEVITAIDQGRAGELAMPAYVRWAPFYWVLPASVRAAARAWSGMDRAMESFRGRAKVE